jgi:glycosyltransferase involved in cell wall biosynthesis
MDISVAMCTYNGEKFLGEQLKSIRRQTKLPLEVVVCDDGSTDATPRLVREFAASAPFPVVFVANRVTLKSTRNFDQAIGLCRGQAIALCDQDDLWAPEKLQRVEQVLENQPGLGGVFSNAFLVNEKSQLLPVSLWEQRKYTPRLQAEFCENGSAQLLQFNPATGATFVFRSEFVEQFAPIPEEWVHDAWIALIIATQSRIQLLPEKLISYRIHPSQQIGVKRATPSDDLLIKRWALMEARLSTLTVDPRIMRVVHKKLQFFKTRRALRQRHLAGRVLAASRTLPGYFRFARGLYSYVRDVVGQGYPLESRAKP